MAAASHAATSVGSGIDDVDMEGTPTSLDPAGSAFSERVVCPGDDVTDFISAHPAMAAAHATGVPTLKLGVGLLACAGERVTATKAGVLTFVKPNRFFVLNAQTRYVAAQGDQVIGIVVDKNADFYRVKLHGSAVAMLPALAFDGASKRNKPSIPVGAPIFARVVSCPKSMDPELSCQAAGGPKKDWMTGQSVYGELQGGNIVRVSLAYARRLIAEDCAVLTALGRAIPFEIAVGLNGVVWIHTATVYQNIAISNAIARCEHESGVKEVEAIVAGVLKALVA